MERPEARHMLAERLKELNCLYAISKAIDRRDASLHGVLGEIVSLVPHGWQYPEVACARIVFNDSVFESIAAHILARRNRLRSLLTEFPSGSWRWDIRSPVPTMMKVRFWSRNATC